jgi:hypothetical protein
MRRRLLGWMFAIAPALASGASEEVWIDAEAWARPRSGAVVASMPAVRTLVQTWMDRPGWVLQIRYPGGEEGLLWAEELHDWLIALGVSSRSLRKLPGVSAEDRLELAVRRPAED